MSDILTSLACQIFLMVVGALVGTTFEKARKADEKREALEAAVTKRQDDMASGLRVLLKSELRRIHLETIARGTISHEDEQFAEDIYQRYHDLGGNGQATAMMIDIRRYLKGAKE